MNVIMVIEHVGVLVKLDKVHNEDYTLPICNIDRSI